MVSKNLVMLKVSSRVSLQKKNRTIFCMPGLWQYRDHRPVISILSFLINLNHQPGGAPDETRRETKASFLLGLHSPYKTVSLSYHLGCPAEYNCNWSHQDDDKLLSQKISRDKNLTQSMPDALISWSGMLFLHRQRRCVCRLFNITMATKNRQA